MALIPQVGAQIYVGYAYETTAGTPVAPTDFIPVDPDSVTLGFDPKRNPLEVALNTLFIDQYITENDATVSGEIKFPLFSDLGMKLIFSGLSDAVTGTGPYQHAGTIIPTLPLTLEVGRSNGAIQYAGCYARSIKIEASSKNAVMVTMGFDGLARPNVLGSPSLVSIGPDYPYLWAHTQNATLPGQGASVGDLDNIEINIEWDNQLYYGNAGSNMPTVIIPGPVRVSGKFTKLFEDISDYNQFNNAGEVPATMQFNFVRDPNNSVVLALSNAYYQKADFKNPLRGPVVTDFSFGTQAPGGGSPIFVTVTNSRATAYH